MRTKGSVDYPDGLELYEDSPGYYEEKMQLLDKEREILKVLNFDLSVDTSCVEFSQRFIRDLRPRTIRRERNRIGGFLPVGETARLRPPER